MLFVYKGCLFGHGYCNASRKCLIGIPKQRKLSEKLKPRDKSWLKRAAHWHSYRLAMLLCEHSGHTNYSPQRYPPEDCVEHFKCRLIYADCSAYLKPKHSTHVNLRPANRRRAEHQPSGHDHRVLLFAVIS